MLYDPCLLHPHDYWCKQHVWLQRFHGSTQDQSIGHIFHTMPAPNVPKPKNIYWIGISFLPEKSQVLLHTLFFQSYWKPSSTSGTTGKHSESEDWSGPGDEISSTIRLKSFSETARVVFTCGQIKSTEHMHITQNEIWTCALNNNPLTSKPVPTLRHIHLMASPYTRKSKTQQKSPRKLVGDHLFPLAHSPFRLQCNLSIPGRNNAWIQHIGSPQEVPLKKLFLILFWGRTK